MLKDHGLVDLVGACLRAIQVMLGAVDMTPHGTAQKYPAILQPHEMHHVFMCGLCFVSFALSHRRCHARSASKESDLQIPTKQNTRTNSGPNVNATGTLSPTSQQP